MENNKSDLSIGDISTWFQGKSPPNLSNLTPNRKVVIDKHQPFLFIFICNLYAMHFQDPLSTVTEANSFDTDLQNFKDLLHKVKEIMDGEIPGVSCKYNIFNFA